jgi:Fic family protein
MTLPFHLFDQYKSMASPIVLPSVDTIEAQNSFGYEHNNQLSAIYSSNIEGNTIDINTYFNYSKASKKHKEKQEIDDLALAYQFAQSNNFTVKNILKAHSILSKSFLEPFQRGKYKVIPNGVFGESGMIFLACEVDKTKTEFESLIEQLLEFKNLETNYDIDYAFFLASLLHLITAHIHPFADGNGRLCRLIEKWYLSQYIGKIAFYLPTEKYYKNHQSEYYQNINLGQNYDSLDYGNSMQFLGMLREVAKN